MSEVASMSGVMLGEVVKVVGSNLARAKNNISTWMFFFTILLLPTGFLSSGQ